MHHREAGAAGEDAIGEGQEGAAPLDDVDIAAGEPAPEPAGQTPINLDSRETARAAAENIGSRTESWTYFKDHRPKADAVQRPRQDAPLKRYPPDG